MGALLFTLFIAVAMWYVMTKYGVLISPFGRGLVAFVGIGLMVWIQASLFAGLLFGALAGAAVWLLSLKVTN